MSTTNDPMDVISTTVDTLVKGLNQNKEMSPEPLSTHLNYAMSAVVGPILCFLGMFGNVLAVLVWCKPGLRSSTGRYLIGQAVADFFVLFFFLVCDSVKAWAPSLLHSVSYAVFFCYIGYPMFFLAIVCSIWFTVGVTVDRYIMVCWITKAKHYCNERRANLGLLLITVNSFLVNMPHFMSYEAVYDFNASNPDTGDMAFKATEFGGGSGGAFYEFWIHCIILILIPWTSVLGMNVMIIKKINASNKKMSDKKTTQSIRNSKQSENQITRLLLTVTFTFLFFIGLQCIIQCLWMQKPPGADMEMVERAFAFAKTGIVFNSSSNFLLYCMSGRRFRGALMDMLGVKVKGSHLASVVERPSTTGVSASTTSTTGM